MEQYRKLNNDDMYNVKITRAGEIVLNTPIKQTIGECTKVGAGWYVALKNNGIIWESWTAKTKTQALEKLADYINSDGNTFSVKTI